MKKSLYDYIMPNPINFCSSQAKGNFSLHSSTVAAIQWMKRKRFWPGENLLFFLLKDIQESLDQESSNLVGWNEIFSNLISICTLTTKIFGGQNRPLYFHNVCQFIGAKIQNIDLYYQFIKVIYPNSKNIIKLVHRLLSAATFERRRLSTNPI